MSDIGLPKPLETLLASLLQTQPVSSWQIRSGSQYTQVTLRFNMADIDVNNVSYRKKPPSQVQRDTTRVARWKNQTHEKDSSTIEDKQEETDAGNQQCSGKEYSTSVPNVCNTIVTINQPAKSGQTNQVQNNAQDIGLEGDQAATASQAPQVEEHYVNSNDHHNDTSQEGSDIDLNPQVECVSRCDLCHSDIEAYSKRLRCTECEELDICGQCWDSGEHQEHASQVHRYDSSPFVDSIHIQLSCMRLSL